MDKKNKPIKTSLFQTCVNTYDKDTGIIRKSTSSELVKCCLKRRYENSNYCHKQCEKERNGDICRGNCDNFRTLGVLDCLAMSPGFNIDNDYYKCATKSNCPADIGPGPNALCVEKNKKNIYDCCISKCTYGDCENYCKTWETIVLDPTSIGIPADIFPYARSYIKYNENKNPKDTGPWQKTINEETTSNEEKSSTPLYIGIGVGVGVIILLFVYLLLETRLKFQRKSKYNK